MPNLAALLRDAERRFAQSSPSARLDAEVLLAHVLQNRAATSPPGRRKRYRKMRSLISPGWSSSAPRVVPWRI
jgi:hypothetical protein